jgi:hypothetical protein
MHREELVSALRRLKIVEALRALAPGDAPPQAPAADAPAAAPAPSRAAAVRLVGAVRRHPDRVVAAVVAAGVLAMVFHWR